MEFMGRKTAIGVRLYRRKHGERFTGYVVSIWCNECKANIAYCAEPYEFARSAERKLIDAWNRRTP